GNRRCSAECRGSAQNSARVSRILNSVEHHQAALWREVEGINRSRRDFCDRQHTLWRFGLGGRSEILLGNLRHLDAGLTESRSQGLAARSGGKLRRDKRSSDPKGRAKEFLDRSNAFGDEQRVLFAGLSAAQIAGKCKKLHAFSTRGSAGIGFASASL